MQTAGPFWEERLVRPIDIYPEYRIRDDFEGGVQRDATHFWVEQYFVRIETDEGLHGIAGPLPEMVALFVAKRLRPILLNQDPIAHEKLWDQMHRIMVHGRQGDAMLAISAVDCALWDLKGNWLGQPVFRLLGGRVMRRCSASRCATWGGCGTARRNTRRWAIARRNGSSVTVR
jgi:L-alanine-DL-glutamate epimerase-like enolase superfamily enzyme